MGGLRKKLPITYATFLVATLALSGIPLTSGFLSKDGILAGTLAYTSLTGNWFFSLIGFTVAALTAFYMFRLVILTFHGETRNKEKYDHAHESPFLMIMPLVLLSGLSIFIWYTPNPFNADSGWVLSKWVKPPTIVTPESSRYPFMVEKQKEESIAEHDEEVTFSHEYTHAMHSAHVPTIFISGFVAGLGILFAFLFYQWKKFDANTLAAKIKPLYNLSFNKWYFDEFYNSFFVGGTLALSNFLRWFDNTIIDGIVNGSATLTRKLSKISGQFDNGVVDGLVNFMAYFSGFIGLFLRKFQTGKVQTYIVLVIFSLLIILFLFKSF
jgi:NADH-quinone oxidoreductase subunit L